MLSGFKVYFIFITMLIFAQIVIASENFINFHHEMRNYESEKSQRGPDQIKEDKNIEKIELQNPEIEIRLDDQASNKTDQ